MPQACQDPASDDLNADLDLSLVAWLVGPRRNDGSAVMPRHVGIGPVDHRFVKARLGDPGLEIVAVLCLPRLCGEPPRIAVPVTATGHISIRGQRAIRAALVRSAKLVFGEVPPKRSKEA